MPYCSQCGTAVHERDVFCAHCGRRQPNVEPPAPPGADPFDRLTPRTASILCYIPVVGWVFAVIVLAARKFRNNHAVRFHAFQGLYLFATWLFVNWVVRPMVRDVPGPMYRIDHVLEAVILAAWIFMIVKASHEEMYSLPILGELAERSVAEK